MDLNLNLLVGFRWFEDEALVKIAEMAAKEKTGARGLVSAIEKVLIPFEKKLPTVGITNFLVTPEVVESSEEQLELLLKKPDDPAIAERFKRARERELQNIKDYIAGRADDFRKISGLDLYERRMDILAQLYLMDTSDINAIFDDFEEMHREVKFEEALLAKKLEMDVSFDESAIDAIIAQAIETGRKIGFLAEELGKQLEYGLNLVKDRSGIETFTINETAILDMEGFIASLRSSLTRGPCLIFLICTPTKDRTRFQIHTIKDISVFDSC